MPTIALARGLNALALYAIAGILGAAFYFQLAGGDLPCPLCLLQRVAFTALAVGPILNIRYGPRPAHYGLSLLAAMVGAVLSARQILLHITPGDPGYGPPLMGLHFYTWAFIAFCGAIAAIGLMLQWEGQFTRQEPAPPVIPLSVRAAVWAVIGLTALNVLSTFLECGLAVCPENPVAYELLR